MKKSTSLVAVLVLGCVAIGLFFGRGEGPPGVARSGDTSSEVSSPSSLPGEAALDGPESGPRRASKRDVVEDVTGEDPVQFIVRGDDGPLGGATVTLFALNDEGLLFATEVHAVTDSEGTCSLLLPSDGRCLVGDDGITFSAELEGYSTVVESFSLRRRPVKFRLRSSCAVFGRVMEFETQTPIAGARMVFGECFELAAGSRVETQTDAQGAYRYEGVRRGQQAVITVLREGCLFHSMIVDVGEEAEQRADIFVPAGLSITGRVFDGETGASLDGVQISRITRITRTDDLGRFRVRGLTGDWVAVGFSKPGYGGAQFFAPAAEVDPSKDLRIAMFRSCTIEGQVLDATGAPVVSAPVTYEQQDRESTADPLPARFPGYDWEHVTLLSGAYGEIQTDVEGRFRVAGLKALSRPVRVHTVHPALDVSIHSDWLRFSSFGETQQVVLRHAVGASIEGVIRPAGPAWRVAWAGPRTLGMVRADEDGRYVLRGVEDGQVQVHVLRPGSSSVDTDPTEDEEALASTTIDVEIGQVLRRDFEVHLDPARTRVSGIVVDQDGEPRRGVMIQAYLLAANVEGATDDQGHFELDLPGESGADGFLIVGSPWALQVEVAAVVGGEALRIVLPEGQAVRFQVIDGDSGLPLPRARVGWEQKVAGAAAPISATTLIEGTAQEASAVWLPVGTITLTVFADALGYSPTVLEDFQVTADVASAPVTVRMKKDR